MPRTKISEFSATPANNTDIDSINISEGCAPSGINDAIRELMAQLKDWQSGTSNDPYVVGSSGSLTLNQGTANGVAYLNGSKVVTSGSTLVFDSSNRLSVNQSSSLFGAQLEVTGGAVGQAIGIHGRASDGIGVLQFGANGASTEYARIQSDNTSSLQFGVGSSGTEQMRLTSTGLGIGTSSPAYKLEVNGQIGCSDNFVFTTANPAIVVNSGYLRVFTGGSERMRIDSSGNLGLGVTPSASNIPSIQSSFGIFTGNNQANIAANAYYNNQWNYTSTAVASLYTQTAGQHRFFTAASGTAGNAITFTQAMSLTAAGDLLVGTTDTTVTNGAFVLYGSGVINSYLKIGHKNGSNSGADFVACYYNGTQIGGVSQNGTTAVAFNTSSDYRLKNTIAPMTGALAKVALLKPVTYKWNADGSDGDGFIAHELAEVCPHAVTGEKDAVDADGNPKYQGIDTSFLVATLTAALQELNAKFDAYVASHP
jgi:hypothetical protein